MALQQNNQDLLPEQEAYEMFQLDPPPPPYDAINRTVAETEYDKSQSQAYAPGNMEYALRPIYRENLGLAQPLLSRMYTWLGMGRQPEDERYVCEDESHKYMSKTVQCPRESERKRHLLDGTELPVMNATDVASRGPPIQCYKVSRFSGPMLAESRLTAVEVIDTNFVYCIPCQSFHRDTTLRCRGDYFPKSTKSGKDRLVLNFTMEIAQFLPRTVMLSHRRGLGSKGIPIDALHAVHEWDSGKCFVHACIRDERLFMKFISTSGYVGITDLEEYLLNIPTCGHETLSVQRLCNFTVMACLTEGTYSVVSDLFRCHQCPSEYRVHVIKSLRKTKTLYCVFLRHYIDAGDLLNGYDDVHWKALVSPKRNCSGIPYELIHTNYMTTIEARAELTPSTPVELLMEESVRAFKSRILNSM